MGGKGPRKLTHPVALVVDDGPVPLTPDEAAAFHRPGYVYINPKNGEQLVLVVSVHERNHFKRKQGQKPDMLYSEKFRLWQAGNGDEE